MAIANLSGIKSDKTLDIFYFGVYVLLCLRVLSIEFCGNKLISIILSGCQREEICKIDGPLIPLWVKIKP